MSNFEDLKGSGRAPVGGLAPTLSVEEIQHGLVNESIQRLSNIALTDPKDLRRRDLKKLAQHVWDRIDNHGETYVGVFTAMFQRWSEAINVARQTGEDALIHRAELHFDGFARFLRNLQFRCASNSYYRYEAALNAEGAMSLAEDSQRPAREQDGAKRSVVRYRGDYAGFMNVAMRPEDVLEACDALFDDMTVLYGHVLSYGTTEFAQFLPTLPFGSAQVNNQWNDFQTRADFFAQKVKERAEAAVDEEGLMDEALSKLAQDEQDRDEAAQDEQDSPDPLDLN